MKAEKQQREATSRVIQPSKGGMRSFEFADNKISKIKQLYEVERNLGYSAVQNIEFIYTRKPNISGPVVQLATTWQWTGTYWDALRTDGYPSAQPNRPGAYLYEVVATKEDAVEDVEPPLGYSLVTDSVGRQAYLHNPNDYVVGRVALDHLIDIAHGNEHRIHRSAQMAGTLIPTYIHPNDDELYTFTTQDNHIDGIPKITIYEQGKVRGGVHKFGK